MNVENKEYLLRDHIQGLKDDYDYIIIDCPPSLSLLTLNALCAASSVIIPIQCEYYALEGLSQILKTLELIHERLNADLKVEGIVFTMFDSRNNLSADVVANVKENLDIPLFDTIIPRNVRLSEAPSREVSIFEYDTKSEGAKAYAALVREVISHNEKGGR